MKLLLDNNFEIDNILRFAQNEQNYTFQSKQSLEFIFGKFIPFFEKSGDSEIKCTLKNESENTDFKAVTAGFHFDKKGNIQFNLVKKEINDKSKETSRDYPGWMQISKMGINNIFNIINLQDKIIRELANSNELVKSSNAVKEYLDKYPVSLSINRETDDLNKFFKEYPSNDYFELLKMTDKEN